MPLQILMFHGICKSEYRAPEGQNGLYVGELRFRRFLENISQHVRIVSMDDVIHNIYSNEFFSKNIIAITFDDGLRNNFETARPHLKELGIPATFYINTANIGNDEKFMCWHQIDKLNSDPLFNVGGHSHDHLDLASLNHADLDYQIGECSRHLRNHGIPVAHFAYPYGQVRHVNKEVVESLVDHGFKCAPTAQIGLNDHRTNPFDLKRIAIT